MAAAGRFLSRPAYRLVQVYGASRYSTDKGQRKVQTPLQSQKTDNVAPNPLKPEAESTQMQTPMQSQNPADFGLQAARQTAQPPSRPSQPSKARPDNTGPITAFFVSLLVIPALSYAYYNYRKEHMDKKWEGMLKEAEQKRRSG